MISRLPSYHTSPQFSPATPPSQEAKANERTFLARQSPFTQPLYNLPKMLLSLHDSHPQNFSGISAPAEQRSNSLAWYSRLLLTRPHVPCRPDPPSMLCVPVFYVGRNKQYSFLTVEIWLCYPLSLRSPSCHSPSASCRA